MIKCYVNVTHIVLNDWSFFTIELGYLSVCFGSHPIIKNNVKQGNCTLQSTQKESNLYLPKLLKLLQLKTHLF